MVVLKRIHLQADDYREFVMFFKIPLFPFPRFRGAFEHANNFIFVAGVLK